MIKKVSEEKEKLLKINVVNMFILQVCIVYERRGLEEEGLGQEYDDDVL